MSIKFEFRQKFANIAWNVLMLKCCFKFEMQIKLGILILSCTFTEKKREVFLDILNLNLNILFRMPRMFWRYG